MFRFGNDKLLYFLFILPLMILVYIIMQLSHRKSLKDFVDTQFHNTLMPLFSRTRRNIKFILILLAVAFLIIAVSRPQFGSKLEEIKREGIEIIIALDVSRSMMAQDIHPNRLERAKQAITSMINHMQDDKIGMIIFAGDAYTQLPITSDYVSARMFLTNINTEIVSKQGTAIASAIELGSKSFTQDEKVSKAIIIISDGEDHEGDAVAAAEAVVGKGVRVYTIGMGSSEGAPIPLRKIANESGFLKDKQGNVIISRSDNQMLNKIAAAGNGEFFKASSGNVGLEHLYNKLNKLDKAKIETRVYSEYNDQYMYFAGMSLLLLLVDFLILGRKNKKLLRFSFFNKSEGI